MDTTQALIIALLKSAITGQAVPLPQDYDLQQVLNMAYKHQIVGLVYQGAVICGIDPKLPQMQQLFQLYCRTIQHSEAQLLWVEKLFHAFEEAGIDYMPLKGCLLKQLYPKPELRTMGDADILIRVAQQERIRQIMQNLGFTHTMESDHELNWTAPGLHVELHKRLIPSYNKDYFAYYGDGWKFAKIKSGFRYAMTKEDTFVFVFAHFAKHFRDGGAGYRYVTDLWVYLRENPDLDHAYINRELEKLQMTQFYQRVRRLISCWFEDGSADDMLERMAQYIHVGGVWGDMESKAVSRTLRASQNSQIQNHGRLVYLKELFFPDAQTIEYQYRFLEKAPWLLPVAWVMRGVRNLFRPKRMAQKRKEFQALDQKAIQTREAFLEQVGLEYHF